MRGGRLAGGLVAALCLCGAAAGCGGDPNRSRAHARAHERVDAQLRADFAVLRRPRTTADRLRPGIAADRFAVDPRATRLAYGRGTSQLFAAQAGGQVCLLDSRDVVSNCWPKRRVLAGDASVAALCARNLPQGTIQLAGLVPDGVERVTVVLPGRPDLSVRVAENAWLAFTPARDPLPLTLRWRLGDRVQRRPSGIPVGTTYEGCDAAPRPG